MVEQRRGKEQGPPRDKSEESNYAMPSYDEARDSIGRLFWIFRRTRAWVCERFTQVRAVRRLCADASRCVLRAGFDGPFVFAELLCHEAELTGRACATVAHGAARIERRYLRAESVDEGDEGAGEEAVLAEMPSAVYTAPDADMLQTLTAPYVRGLPEAIHVQARALHDAVRRKVDVLTMSTSCLQRCLHVMLGGVDACLQRDFRRMNEAVGLAKGRLARLRRQWGAGPATGRALRGCLLPPEWGVRPLRRRRGGTPPAVRVEECVVCYGLYPPRGFPAKNWAPCACSPASVAGLRICSQCLPRIGRCIQCRRDVSRRCT